MSKTKNYNLYLEGDATTKFKEWREKLNGLVNSNMEIIDEVLGAKADQCKPFQLVLSTSAWTWNGSVFTQDLEIEGLTSDSNGIIGLGQGLTMEQIEDVYRAELIVGDQSDGILTIIANGDKPESDIPVVAILLG